jgi:hypothetical protein
MTAPDPAPALLEEAAAELRKARDANERRAEAIKAAWGDMPQYAERRVPAEAEVNARRMEIAAAFTRLAAIEASRRTAPGTVTLRWEDPEDAAEFLRIREEYRRQNWIPDASKGALLELLGESEIVSGGSDEGNSGG